MANKPERPWILRELMRERDMGHLSIHPRGDKMVKPENVNMEASEVCDLLDYISKLEG